MGEVFLFQQTAAVSVQNSAKRKLIPAEDEILLRRMRRVWRRCEDMLGDIETVADETDPDISDRTLRAWWAREHRITWAGGKLIERAMKYRLSETSAAVLECEAAMRKSSREFQQKLRLVSP